MSHTWPEARIQFPEAVSFQSVLIPRLQPWKIPNQSVQCLPDCYYSPFYSYCCKRKEALLPVFQPLLKKNHSKCQVISLDFFSYLALAPIVPHIEPSFRFFLNVLFSFYSCSPQHERSRTGFLWCDCPLLFFPPSMLRSQTCLPIPCYVKVPSASPQCVFSLSELLSADTWC